MRRPRRNRTAAFKAKVALAALKGDKTLAERAEKYDVRNAGKRWRHVQYRSYFATLMPHRHRR